MLTFCFTSHCQNKRLSVKRAIVIQTSSDVRNVKEEFGLEVDV